MAQLSIDELRRYLDYNPATGVFTRKVFTSNRSRELRADRTFRNGYQYIALMGERYLAHRVAWAFVYGAWPVDKIDHIDGDPTNNRIDNLRDCCQSENMYNRGAQVNNTSGFKGVSWSKKHKKWYAQISVGKRHRSLGLYDDIDFAIIAYRLAAEADHKEFARVK